jgi:hypothetical protein
VFQERLSLTQRNLISLTCDVCVNQQGSAPALTLLTLGMTGMVAAGTLGSPLAQRSALGPSPYHNFPSIRNQASYITYQVNPTEYVLW